MTKRIAPPAPPSTMRPAADVAARLAQLPDFKAVPRRYRHDGWTPERQRAFIAALADMGSVKAAARSIGMTSESAYCPRRQRGVEGFAAAWLAALDHGVRRLEDIALERAIHGVEVPVYSYGKLVGTRRVFNDRLLMFMLRNRAPDRFTPRASVRPQPVVADPMAERPDSPDAIQRVKEVLETIRRYRAAEEAAPQGPITIRGDERVAFERWKAGGEAVADGRVDDRDVTEGLGIRRI
ncbi:hypothetical protein MOK15_10305 [Sphingobium sp. BYY-5]|uniref:hypothetical protein n=1 Tax=Sphingobium sp. BYY-5 TaxID=2926400 RepID=UPI001FA7E46A|nr:hypothetical protein [Sphingobium sp. BYY-5]MCI4590487.1 hypothetical protein [Sphingobium sp. BYY-5]